MIDLPSQYCIKHFKYCGVLLVQNFKIANFVSVKSFNRFFTHKSGLFLSTFVRLLFHFFSLTFRRPLVFATRWWWLLIFLTLWRWFFRFPFSTPFPRVALTVWRRGFPQPVVDAGRHPSFYPGPGGGVGNVLQGSPTHVLFVREDPVVLGSERFLVGGQVSPVVEPPEPLCRNLQHTRKYETKKGTKIIYNV